MSNFHIKKPTQNQIKLWVENLLDEEEMKEVAAGLLFFKDEATQQYLQECLLDSVAPQKTYSSRMKWVQERLQNIFASYKKSYEAMQLTLPYGEHRPLYLSSKAENLDNDSPEQEYTVTAQSNSDLRLLIRLPQGRYLITTIFVNTEEDLGIIYPNKNDIKTIDDLISEGNTTFQIIKKGEYEISEDEVDFIVTRCPAEQKHLEYFMSCIQEIEEIGVIRWLRYIEQNDRGDFNVVNLRFRKS